MSLAGRIELGINIDHVATVRQARRAGYPDPVHAALLAEQAGADNITLHLREDRRHIQDRDVHALRPLQSFLQKNALRMVDAMRVPTQHGSIRVSAVPLAPNDKTPWKVTPRCADMLIAEGTEATDAGVLSSAIAESRVHIRQKLDALKAAGKVVCGYGAPAQLTTTCYALGITAEDMTGLRWVKPSLVAEVAFVEWTRVGLP